MVEDLTEKGIEADFLSTLNISINATYKTPDILLSPAMIKFIMNAAKATIHDALPSGPSTARGVPGAFLFNSGNLEGVPGIPL